MLLSATSTITDVALSFILFSSTVQYVLYSYKKLIERTKKVLDKGNRTCYNNQAVGPEGHEKERTETNGFEKSS